MVRRVKRTDAHQDDPDSALCPLRTCTITHETRFFGWREISQLAQEAMAIL